MNGKKRNAKKATPRKTTTNETTTKEATTIKTTIKMTTKKTNVKMKVRRQHIKENYLTNPKASKGCSTPTKPTVSEEHAPSASRRAPLRDIQANNSDAQSKGNIATAGPANSPAHKDGQCKDVEMDSGGSQNSVESMEVE